MTALELTRTWVDTDGEHVLINPLDAHRKPANTARDPRDKVVQRPW